MFDIELTRHLAELSKIEFNDEELNKMTSDMKDIINLMDKVCEFDNSKKTYALDAVDYNNLRKDNHSDSYPTEKIIENAKNVKNNSFVVPKVV
ncbi:MAG: Asp-tRNA(Asn)/Glu-tRNA(Gln) amidotransferase subunit GatC [Clostridia bacterium]